MDASTQTSPSAVDAEVVTRLATLLVGFGANVQPDQIVEVRANLEQTALVRKIAELAYRRGARFVDALYVDPWVRRARALDAPEDTLEFAPQWERDRLRQLGEQRCARISIVPLVPFTALEGVDPVRAGKQPTLPESFQLIVDRTTNWTLGPGVERSWAQRVHPELGEEDAYARLWADVIHVCRLDGADPEAAWRERFAELTRIAGALNDARFDHLRYRGPGTDLTIGLLPTSIWTTGTETTVAGIEHAPNLPSEEIFTAPDPERTEGVVSSTRPLAMAGGALVTGLRVTFEGGRATRVDAERGAEALEHQLGRDEGARRLGEVALVDATSRVGELETTFYNTLLDENAAPHLALGGAYPQTVADEDRGRVNSSIVHVDFMVGGTDVDVTGVTRDGREVPILRGGAWQL